MARHHSSRARARRAPPSRPPPLADHTVTREFRVLGLETKFFGRRQHLETLYNGIRDAVNNRSACAIPIVGRGGLGKTRLVHEFTKLIDIEARGITLYTTDSDVDEGAHSLRFTDQLLRQRFAVPPGMEEAQVVAQLERGLRGIVEGRKLSDAVMLLSHLMSLPMPEDSRPNHRVPNDTFHQRAKSTLFNLLRFDASRRPMIIVADSFQDAGQGTRDTMRELARALAGSPVLIIATSRRAIAAKVFGGVEVRNIALERLPDPTMNKILRHLLRRVHELPDSLAEGTVARAKGNPALLEDIVRLMLQRGILLDMGERWELRSERLKGARLPGTTGGLAKARVGELGEKERGVLEMAAIFGPVFWFGGVLSMMRLERDAREDEETSYWMEDRKESRLNATLLEMQGNDLVEFRTDSGLPNEVSFGFVNPIEQQKLYAGMVEARRRTLHRVAGQWLTLVAPKESFQLREVIAWHYDQGGEPLRAAEAYSQAAQLARGAYQNRRAADLYRRALEFYDVPAAPDRCRVLGELADVNLALGEYAEAADRSREMLYVSSVAGSKLWGGRAYQRLGQALGAQADYTPAMEYLERGLKLFQDGGDMAGIADCLDHIGKLHWYRGDIGSYKHALSYFLKSLSLRRKVGDQKSVALSLGNIGNVHLGRGHVKHAAESFAEALQIRRRLSDRWGMALTLIGVGAVHHECGRPDKAVAAWEEGLQLASQVGDRELSGILQNNLAESYLTEQRLEPAEKLLVAAHETVREIGDKRTLADVLRNKAKLASVRGHFERAVELIGESRALAESIDAKQLIGHALRSEGEILGRLLMAPSQTTGFSVANADNRASQCFQRSMAYFEEMGDTLGLARSMRAYGNYLMERGVTNKARKLLSRADEIRAGGT